MTIQIRYSNDGANNWSDWRSFPAPETGNHWQQMIVRRLGMARHRVWELRDTSDVAQDILAASLFVEAE